VGLVQQRRNLLHFIDDDSVYPRDMMFALLAASLTFLAPPEWKPVAVSSTMRVAQWALPHAAGDTQDAELIVYYFGGQGGSLDANIERWTGQMQQPDGRPSTAVKRDSRTINGLKVTLVDLTGTYVAEMAPGSGQLHHSPNFRMRAGYIETANGPYFIKLVGPAKTVGAFDKQFESFLSSVKFTK
jgi:hypothetical protein